MEPNPPRTPFPFPLPEAGREVRPCGRQSVRFLADLFEETRIAEPEFLQPSLQAAIQALGYIFGRAEETLTARPPTAFEAETLELEPGEWVVQVLRASYSSEDTPVHTLETICAATRHTFPMGQVAGTDEF
jgi:GntR family transcriptional regulator